MRIIPYFPPVVNIKFMLVLNSLLAHENNFSYYCSTGFLNFINMESIAKHVTFSGRVQGVGFRFTALNVANRYNLVGFVRNLPDGGVEMLMQGTPDMIDDCIHDLQDSFAGYVSDTDIKEMPVNPSLTDFKITF